LLTQKLEGGGAAMLNSLPAAQGTNPIKVVSLIIDDNIVVIVVEGQRALRGKCWEVDDMDRKEAPSDVFTSDRYF
jgi:hypothetical protein